MTQSGNTVETRLVGELDPEVIELIEDFATTCKPVNSPPLLVMRDNATGAVYVEAHVTGSRLVPVATTDAPLDPDEGSSTFRVMRWVFTPRFGWRCRA